MGFPERPAAPSAPLLTALRGVDRSDRGVERGSRGVDRGMEGRAGAAGGAAGAGPVCRVGPSRTQRGARSDWAGSQETGRGPAQEGASASRPRGETVQQVVPAARRGRPRRCSSADPVVPGPACAARPGSPPRGHRPAAADRTRTGRSAASASPHTGQGRSGLLASSWSRSAAARSARRRRRPGSARPPGTGAAADAARSGSRRCPGVDPGRPGVSGCEERHGCQGYRRCARRRGRRGPRPPTRPSVRLRADGRPVRTPHRPTPPVGGQPRLAAALVRDGQTPATLPPASFPHGAEAAAATWCSSARTSTTTRSPG